MNSSTANITAASYVLGDQEIKITDIAKWRDIVESLEMIDDSNLWGWGNVFKSNESIESLAINSANKTLQQYADSNGSIDAVFICSSSFSSGAEMHGDFIQRVTGELMLGNAQVLGITLNRCTNLINTLKLAKLYVESSSINNVLVITVDKAERETERITNFALFSDGAASCIVTSGQGYGNGYSILSTSESQEHGDISTGALSSSLIKSTYADLFSNNSLSLKEIEKVFSTNIYLPISTMKELQSGLNIAQLYTDNVMRTGHCFSADPIINLNTYESENGVEKNAHYILAASVPGARSNLLLRKN